MRTFLIIFPLCFIKSAKNLQLCLHLFCIPAATLLLSLKKTFQLHYIIFCTKNDTHGINLPVEHKKQIIREFFYTLLLSLIKSSKLFSLQNSQMCWRWWTRWFMITFTNYYPKLTWLESQFMHPSSSCTDGEMNGHVWFFLRNFTFSTHQLTF